MDQAGDWEGTFWYLVNLLPALPVWLAYLAGIALSVYHWKRNQKTSALTLAAFALFLLNACLGALVNYLITFKLRSYGWDYKTIGRAYFANTLIGSLVNAIAFTLLLVAIFSTRHTRTTGAHHPERL